MAGGRWPSTADILPSVRSVLRPRCCMLHLPEFRQQMVELVYACHPATDIDEPRSSLLVNASYCISGGFADLAKKHNTANPLN